MAQNLQKILEEQKRYYQTRAAEYDQWFYRHGRYDYGVEHTKQWETEADFVRQRLININLTGHILEIAAGTGIWTQELLKTADSVMALDSSAEVLEINRSKLQSDKVTYIVEDIFEWNPQIAFDAVFMGFWLSHIPPTRLSLFMAMLSQALKPGGKIFFVDSLPMPSATAKDSRGDLVRRLSHDALETENDTRVMRRLNDGQEFQIIKVFYTPDDLANQFKAHNIEAVVKQTDNFFLYGWGTNLQN